MMLNTIRGTSSVDLKSTRSDVQKFPLSKVWLLHNKAAYVHRLKLLLWEMDLLHAVDTEMSPNTVAIDKYTCRF